MQTTLSIQSVFDKDIPEDFGNAEYRQERALLIAINELIVQSNLVLGGQRNEKGFLYEKGSNNNDSIIFYGWRIKGL